MQNSIHMSKKKPQMGLIWEGSLWFKGYHNPLKKRKKNTIIKRMAKRERMVIIIK